MVHCRVRTRSFSVFCFSFFNFTHVAHIHDTTLHSWLVQGFQNNCNTVAQNVRSCPPFLLTVSQTMPFEFTIAPMVLPQVDMQLTLGCLRRVTSPRTSCSLNGSSLQVGGVVLQCPEGNTLHQIEVGSTSVIVAMHILQRDPLHSGVFTLGSSICATLVSTQGRSMLQTRHGHLPVPYLPHLFMMYLIPAWFLSGQVESDTCNSCGIRKKDSVGARWFGNVQLWNG